MVSSSVVLLNCVLGGLRWPLFDEFALNMATEATSL